MHVKNGDDREVITSDKKLKDSKKGEQKFKNKRKRVRF